MSFRRARPASWAWLLLPLMISSLARAQTCPDPRRSWEEADALAREGYDHLRARDYLNALAKYRLSYACEPTLDALRSIGAALLGLNRNAEAAAAFEAYLDDAKATDQHERAKMERAKREALAEVGELLVATSEAENGALVYVDGRRAGTTPLARPIRLDPGDHEVFIERGGIRSAPQGVIIEKLRQSQLIFAIPALPTAPPIGSESVVSSQARAREKPTAQHSRNAPSAVPGLANTSKPNDRARERPSKGLRYASFGAGGLAVTALGVGTFYGLSASSTWSTAKQRCPDYMCARPSDTSLGGDAGRAADRATVSFIAAGVMATGALVMYLLAD